MLSVKFTHTADWHVILKEDSTDILEDIKKSIEYIIQESILKKSEFIIIAGDLWDKRISLDSKSPFFFLKEQFAKIPKDIPVIIIYGNHDKERSLDIFADLFPNFIISSEIEPLFFYEKEIVRELNPKKELKSVLFSVPYQKNIHEFMNYSNEETGLKANEKLDINVRTKLVKINNTLKQQIPNYTDIIKIGIMHTTVKNTAMQNNLIIE